MAILCGKGHSHQTVLDVRTCYGVSAVSTEQATPEAPANKSDYREAGATHKQITYAQALLARRGLEAKTPLEDYSKQSISVLIRDLKDPAISTPESTRRPAISTGAAWDGFNALRCESESCGEYATVRVRWGSSNRIAPSVHCARHAAMIKADDFNYRASFTSITGNPADGASLAPDQPADFTIPAKSLPMGMGPVATAKPVPFDTSPVPFDSETLDSGMYKIGAEIFKVQIAVHGSGRKYAKQLEVQTHERGMELAQPVGKFIFCAGAIRKIRPEHKMSLDEAKAFGKIYGVCCKCGRTLTDETSIENGIGPVCGASF